MDFQDKLFLHNAEGKRLHSTDCPAHALGHPSLWHWEHCDAMSHFHRCVGFAAVTSVYGIHRGTSWLVYVSDSGGFGPVGYAKLCTFHWIKTAGCTASPVCLVTFIHPLLHRFLAKRGMAETLKDVLRYGNGFLELHGRAPGWETVNFFFPIIKNLRVPAVITPFLASLLSLFSISVQSHVFDFCQIPLPFHTLAVSTIYSRVSRVHYETIYFFYSLIPYIS